MLYWFCQLWVFYGNRRNFCSGGQIKALGHVVQFKLLSDQLVGSPFPDNFDVPCIFPRFLQVAVIVFCVPYNCMLTGRTGGAGDSINIFSFLCFLKVFTVPSSEVGKPLVVVEP